MTLHTTRFSDQLEQLVRSVTGVVPCCQVKDRRREDPSIVELAAAPEHFDGTVEVASGGAGANPRHLRIFLFERAMGTEVTVAQVVSMDPIEEVGPDLPISQVLSQTDGRIGHSERAEDLLLHQFPVAALLRVEPSNHLAQQRMRVHRRVVHRVAGGLRDLGNFADRLDDFIKAIDVHAGSRFKGQRDPRLMGKEVLNGQLVIPASRKLRDDRGHLGNEGELAQLNRSEHEIRSDTNLNALKSIVAGSLTFSPTLRIIPDISHVDAVLDIIMRGVERS